MEKRQARGRQTYYAGAAAEDCVTRVYERRGNRLIAKRWRGAAGELDLVCAEGDGIVVIEVKKSRSFSRAIEHLGQRQLQRIQLAAEEFVGHLPRGSLTDIRIDLALVDDRGDVRILENVSTA